MYPAPPVTRTLPAILPLQAEEPLERLEQTVAPSGLRGLFERDGRLVQKLVQQGLAEVLDLPTILRAQMGETAQRALQLGGAHLVQPLAELLQDGHDDQSAVPRPEALDLLGHDALRRRDVAAPLGRRLCRHRLQIVDVVQEDVLELGHGGLHIPRHAEIEDAERAAAAARKKPGPPPAPGGGGGDAARVASPVSLRPGAPTSRADWNSRCSTGPACAFDVSQASRTCPWIWDSPRIMASSPAETRYR